MKTKYLRDIQPGDVIVGSQGQPVRVEQAYQEHLPERMFEIEMDDGGLIQASGNHLWYIETQLDREGVWQRIKDAQKLLKGMSQHVKVGLLELAKNDIPQELYLEEIMEVLDPTFSDDIQMICVRIAEALGHVTEDTHSFRDLSTGETERIEMYRSYSGQAFAQQILALSSRRHRRSWHVVVGKVVTTQQLFDFYGNEELPLVKSMS